MEDSIGKFLDLMYLKTKWISIMLLGRSTMMLMDTLAKNALPSLSCSFIKTGERQTYMIR